MTLGDWFLVLWLAAGAYCLWHWAAGVRARLPGAGEPPPPDAPPERDAVIPMTTDRQDSAEVDWLDVDLTDLRFKWDTPDPTPTPWTEALEAAYQRGKDRLPPDA